MANSFSNRKVARAARMGGGRKRKPNAEIGWYATLAAIVLVGSGFVAFSRAEYQDESKPGSTPPLAPAGERAGDQWVEAIGFYTCDKFAPNVPAPDAANSDNDSGITTSGDGIAVIAPTEKQYAGRNATLGLFGEKNGVELDRDSFKLPGDETTYGPGTKCGDKDAKLVIREWENATDPASGETRIGSPETLLLQNRAAVTVGWVPNDFEEDTLPMPPSATNVEARAAEIEAQAGAESGNSPTVGTDPAATAPTAPEAPAPEAPATPAPQ